MSMIRRTLLMSLGAASLLVGSAMAQTNEIKVGLIAPFSGPWARQGELMLKGAELAIDHINSSGGIKSMGGAKLKLLTFDTSDSAEKAKNAAQRMVSQEPDLV
ncbi:MAG: ABC transporter substrate-binding protein, partial [Hyphomicrobiales bacterium]|nr:ABC transporter substrate-binding protein [Hyphomicrobiales bacterium]